MDFKQEIANLIKIDGISTETIYSNIMTPPDEKLGDYTLPCFCFSKVMHKSPVMIAEELKTQIPQTDIIEKVEVVNGYLNFYLNKKAVCEKVINGAQNGFNKKQNKKIIKNNKKSTKNLT